MKLLVLPLTLLAFACDKPAPEAAAPAVADQPAPRTPSEGTPTTPDAPTEPVTAPPTGGTFADVSACALLDVAQVAEALNLPDGAVSSQVEGRPKPHRKTCRYSWTDGSVAASLTLDVELRREGPASAQFDRAVAAHRDGMPVIGREGVTQTFNKIDGIGDTAYYSGNVADMKAIFVVIGDHTAMSLQHAMIDKDSGDLQPALVALAGPVATRLRGLKR